MRARRRQAYDDEQRQVVDPRAGAVQGPRAERERRRRKIRLEEANRIRGLGSGREAGSDEQRERRDAHALAPRVLWLGGSASGSATARGGMGMGQRAVCRMGAVGREGWSGTYCIREGWTMVRLPGFGAVGGARSVDDDAGEDYEAGGVEVRESKSVEADYMREEGTGTSRRKRARAGPRVCLKAGEQADRA